MAEINPAFCASQVSSSGMCELNIPTAQHDAHSPAPKFLEFGVKECHGDASACAGLDGELHARIHQVGCLDDLRFRNTEDTVN